MRSNGFTDLDEPDCVAGVSAGRGGDQFGGGAEAGLTGEPVLAVLGAGARCHLGGHPGQRGQCLEEAVDRVRHISIAARTSDIDSNLRRACGLAIARGCWGGGSRRAFAAVASTG
jgi:hypothetical protein